MTTRLLTLQQLLVVGEVALGGPPAVRDLGLPEPAVHRPASQALGRESLVVSIAEGKLAIEDIARTLYLWSQPGYPPTH